LIAVKIPKSRAKALLTFWNFFNIEEALRYPLVIAPPNPPVNSQAEAKYRSLATHRAQEAMEVFRREKVLLGWAQFSDSIVGDTYCVNTLPSNSTTFQTMETGVCDEEGVIADTIFSREALVDILADRIRVEIVVDWQDGDRDESVSLVQEFRQYD